MNTSNLKYAPTRKCLVSWVLLILLLSILSPLVLGQGAANTADGSAFFSNTYLIFTILFVLLILSGLFSGSETALVSLSMAKVRAMVEAGVKGSKRIEKIKSNPNRMLITILLGNNLVNIGASVMAAVWTDAVFGSAALAIVTAILTILVLIFGEIFPKTLAQQHAETFAGIISRPLLWLETLLYPVIFILEKTLEVSMRYGGKQRKRSFDVDALKELQAMIAIMSEQGQIEDHLQQLVSGSFTFGKKMVADIMTPRSSIIAIDSSLPLQQLRKLFISSGKSRIPVYERSLDRIVGIVNMRMLLRAEDADNHMVREMDMVKPIQVNASLFIDDLLIKLQQERQQMAIAKDKHNQVLGVITLENILEEVVGEIFDEKERFRIFVRTSGKNRWEVTGDCPLYEIKKQFSAFEPDSPPFRSIATVFLENHSQRPLKVGDQVDGSNYIMQIAELKEQTITRLILTKTH